MAPVAARRAEGPKEAILANRKGMLQMLKFGQEVDLEVLEKMSVNKQAEDLKEQLKRLETKNTGELKA